MYPEAARTISTRGSGCPRGLPKATGVYGERMVSQVALQPMMTSNALEAGHRIRIGCRRAREERSHSIACSPAHQLHITPWSRVG
jgi:hypothetical protein